MLSSVRTWLVALLCVMCFANVTAGQIVFNPSIIEFNSPDHLVTVKYQVQFLVGGVVVATGDVDPSKLTVPAPGIPIIYRLRMADVPVSVPFGPTYNLRVLACDASGRCGISEPAPQTMRLTYCADVSGVVPLVIGQDPVPGGVVGQYASIKLNISSLRPVHAVSIALIGAQGPAYYFTGFDLRGPRTYVIGPFKQTGRFLVKIDSADENACGSSVASQYITIK